VTVAVIVVSPQGKKHEDSQRDAKKRARIFFRRRFRWKSQIRETTTTRALWLCGKKKKVGGGRRKGETLKTTKAKGGERKGEKTPQSTNHHHGANVIGGDSRKQNYKEVKTASCKGGSKLL